MKVSLNWVTQYLEFELPNIDEVVERIGSQLGAIEGVENLGEKYQGIVIARVVECVDHPDSDHMQVCKIDDGGKAQDVERDENGLVQVVCGAPNVRAGMLVAWLPPGSTVPESVGKEPFVLGARNLRGVTSNGMLASQRELALGDNHDGILDLTDESVTPAGVPLQPGADFAAVYDLNDYVIDIENKMFTHRPDCFGILGVAREIAGIFNQPFHSPERYRVLDELTAGDGLELAVGNETPENIPRLMAVAIKNVAVKPSPLWLQIELSRVGGKAINNVVDVTNYLMLLTGQPLHAYDYDKVGTGTIVGRFARPGETIALLNGKRIALHEADLVITDGTKPIGLGGVMGGSETEVSTETKNIILECATFDMYTIRRTSMRHGLFTDGVTRFNKGQSPLQNPYITQLAIGHLQTLTGGELASRVFDDDHTQGRTSLYPSIPVAPEFINARLGLDLSAEDMQTLLQHVECTVDVQAGTLTVTAPFWRTDIESREDVVEEIGRLYGFDKLPLELPKRSIRPVTKDPMLVLKSQVRAVLATAGANEALTYSFVHGDLLQKAGQNSEDAFRIGNALSPDLQYYRLSLTPSLLASVHPNIKAGYDEFALFELGKGHNLAHAADDDGLPLEFDMLDLVYARSDRNQKPGAAFYEARRMLTRLANHFGLQLDYRPIEAEEAYPVAKPYDHTRAAQVWVQGTDIALGMIGEYKASVRKQLKLPVHTAGFGIGLQQLMRAAQATTINRYEPIARFPKVTQDITLKVSANTSFLPLYRSLVQSFQELRPVDSTGWVRALDIYQREDDTAHKQITFRLTIANYERTLTDKEVSKLLDSVADAMQHQYGAERI